MELDRHFKGGEQPEGGGGGGDDRFSSTNPERLSVFTAAKPEEAVTQLFVSILILS